MLLRLPALSSRSRRSCASFRNVSHQRGNRENSHKPPTHSTTTNSETCLLPSLSSSHWLTSNEELYNVLRALGETHNSLSCTATIENGPRATLREFYRRTVDFVVEATEELLYVSDESMISSTNSNNSARDDHLGTTTFRPSSPSSLSPDSNEGVPIFANEPEPQLPETAELPAAAKQQQWAYLPVPLDTVTNFLLASGSTSTGSAHAAAAGGTSSLRSAASHVFLFHGTHSAHHVCKEGFKLMDRKTVGTDRHDRCEPDGVFLTPSLSSARMYGGISSQNITEKSYSDAANVISSSSGPPTFDDIVADGAVLVCAAKLGRVYNRLLSPEPELENVIQAGQWRLSAVRGNSNSSTVSRYDTYMDWNDSEQLYCVADPMNVIPVIVMAPLSRVVERKDDKQK